MINTDLTANSLIPERLVFQTLCKVKHKDFTGYTLSDVMIASPL